VVNLTQFETQLLSQGYTRICGVDECGVGSLAGPLIAAAVILDIEKAKKVVVEYSLKRKTKKVKINDSKQLTRRERELLFPEILKVSTSVHFGTSEVDEINDIQNINKCGHLARYRAVKGLSITPDVILVDWFDMPEIKDIPVLHFPKGDERSLSIASASVLAKVIRDTYMEQLSRSYPQYRWETNAGYGTQVHIKSLREFGITDHHRKHFLSKFNL